MHEVSLAKSLVRQVLELQQRERAARVNSVYVRVGEFSGVDAELLRLAFEAVAGEQGVLPAARMILERVPLQARCSACGVEFAVQQFRLACLRCGNRDVTIIGGEELQLERIEMEGP